MVEDVWDGVLPHLEDRAQTALQPPPQHRAVLALEDTRAPVEALSGAWSGTRLPGLGGKGLLVVVCCYRYGLGREMSKEELTSPTKEDRAERTTAAHSD